MWIDIFIPFLHFIVILTMNFGIIRRNLALFVVAFAEILLIFEKICSMLLPRRYISLEDVVSGVAAGVILHILENELLLKPRLLQPLVSLIRLFDPLLAAVVAGVGISLPLIVGDFSIFLLSR